jgi:hypothetical protein
LALWRNNFTWVKRLQPNVSIYIFSAETDGKIPKTPVGLNLLDLDLYEIIFVLGLAYHRARLIGFAHCAGIKIKKQLTRYR